MKMHVHEAQGFAFPNPQAADADTKAAGKASDVIVRLDKAGFVIDASENAVRLGIDLKAQLLTPHISDLTIAQYQQRIARYLINVATGHFGAKSAEHGVTFPVAKSPLCVCADQGDMHCSVEDPDDHHEWVTLTLTNIGGGSADIGPDSLGLVGTLRCVGRKPVTTQPKPATTTIAPSSDPFTGLADRRKFVSSLTSSIAMNEGASVALFAIDGMRAIFMKYGQSTADELRWGFARFLEAMVEPQHALAQVDDERFGVVLPGFQPKEAREWAADALQTFAGLAATAKGNKPQLSASAGIARAEKSAEWAIRQAELGLVMARAAGGMQTAMCRPQPSLSNGRPIEEVMENVVDHALRRAT